MSVLFFSRALHLDPKLVDFYVFRAEAFIQLCDFSSALQNLRRAYSYDPGNNKYLNRLAFVLYLQVPQLPHPQGTSHLIPSYWLALHLQGAFLG